LEAYRQRRSDENAALEKLTPAEDVAAAIRRGEMSLASVSDRPDLLTIQDSIALSGQAGASRERDSLGRSDLSVALIRRMWARELRALSAGQPTKAWAWPADVRVTTVVTERDPILEPSS
jgi:5,5'-dehydrodivanillate O-demethylase